MSREGSHLSGLSPTTNAGDDASATVEPCSDYIGLALTGETEAIMVRLPNHALVIHESARSCRSVKAGQLIRDYARVVARRTNLGRSSFAASAFPSQSAALNCTTLTPIYFHAFPPYEPACRQLTSPNIVTTSSILTRNRFSKTEVTSSADTAVRAASRIGAIARQAIIAIDR